MVELNLNLGDIVLSEEYSADASAALSNLTLINRILKKPFFYSPIDDLVQKDSSSLGTLTSLRGYYLDSEVLKYFRNLFSNFLIVYHDIFGDNFLDQGNGEKFYTSLSLASRLALDAIRNDVRYISHISDLVVVDYKRTGIHERKKISVLESANDPTGKNFFLEFRLPVYEVIGKIN